MVWNSYCTIRKAMNCSFYNEWGVIYDEGYGWNSTVFATVEDFWSERGCSIPDLDPSRSYDKIKAQILKLNPEAERKKLINL